MPDQFAALCLKLAEMGEASPDQMARQFVRLRRLAVEPLLESLAVMGYAERLDNGRYAA